MHRAAVVPLLLASFAAWGHPADAAGFVHPFTGLDHLLAMLAVGMWAAQLGGRWTWAVPLGFVGSMAVGGALGFADVKLPYVEPMIAASVLVLGLLVALRVQLRWSALALVGGFAVFHGIAHAAEMPQEASRLVYAASFVLATVLLHGAGIGLGLLPRSRLAGSPVALVGLWLLGS